ncbi:MAG TPA: c-type cytochrome [Steroidobacteraceae bacterium]|nr:c-type cytochrome [Steroidobacteraceae bacterium]
MKVPRSAIVTLALMVITTLVGCADELCMNLSDRYSGAILFKLHCASCHGEDARGNGPVAEYLNVKVPDLTQISAAHGGTFPEEEVFRIIDGQAEMHAHGTRHMPVWGYEFFGQQADDERAHAQAAEKVDALVNYLRKRQRPAS